MEGCDSKGQGETGRLPVSACFHEPLLQGTGSSKEGLAARKATSWASPPMRLKDTVGWGGVVLWGVRHVMVGEGKNQELTREQRGPEKSGRTDYISEFRRVRGKVRVVAHKLLPGPLGLKLLL